MTNMEYNLTYYLGIEEEEKEITISVDYSVYYDGIGPYEYWGSKGYDKGNLCADINEITYDKEGLSEEEIAVIEAAIDKQSNEIQNACLRDRESIRESYLERE
jgi:hypothetical protein